MFFASDNAGPAHPQIIDALQGANEGYAAPYGSDRASESLRDVVRALFEAPEAAVYLVATGTAANALILGTLTRPFETVFCAPEAHIQQDECNAPEFYTGGAKLTLVPGRDAKIGAAELRAAISAEENRGVHGPQRGPVSITQVTERGTLYSLEEIRAVTEVAGGFGLSVHMDGARLANAVVALGCTPAQITWKAGIDAVSFGGTKNGCLGVEAVIFFDPKHAREFELRRKRGAHLFSKNRFLAAQMLAYLRDDLWLDSARAANAAAARLARGLRQMPQVHLLHEPQANMIFASWPRAIHQRLQDAGAHYELWEGSLEAGDPDEPLTARLVCDWSASDANTDRFLALFRDQGSA